MWSIPQCSLSRRSIGGFILFEAFRYNSPQMLPQLFLSLLILAAQQGVGIRGQIILPTTQSQGRMEVILERSGAFLQKTFSDNEGHFRFINLPDGEYVVIVRAEGYEEVRETANFGRDGIAVMSLTMTRKDTQLPEDLQVLDLRYPRKIVEDYERALDESRKGNTAKAIKILEGVLKVSPDFYQAHNVLGTLYQKGQRFLDAEKEFNEALKFDPLSSEPLVNLGILYIQIAEQAQTKRDAQTFDMALDGAARSLNQAIRVQPDSAKAYFYLGTTYYKGGQYSRAEENLTRALQIEKGMGTAQLVLANVYIKQHKWQQALEYLDDFLKDNPRAANREEIQQTRSKVAAQQ